MSKFQGRIEYDYNYIEFIKVLYTVQNTQMPLLSRAESQNYRILVVFQPSIHPSNKIYAVPTVYHESIRDPIIHVYSLAVT